jgi:thioredoxin reductase
MIEYLKMRKRMVTQTDVAIIGAGPYGLSLASYLRKKKVAFMIFGKPMGTWRDQMPAGMSLKSEGFASNIYHPEGLFTLKEFCASNGIKYADIGVPVTLKTFWSYGVAFQQRFVPDLQETLVRSLSRQGAMFHIDRENGATVQARRVVIAAGITHFRYLPPILAELPSTVVSHSSAYSKLDRFRDHDVLVVGAGSSAVDVAVTLQDAGARPQLVTRRPSISFHGKAPDKRSLITRIRAPWSGLGPSWRSRLACDLPLLFHIMPSNFRSRVVKKHLGPSAGWFTKEKIVGHVPMHVNASLIDAFVRDKKVHLRICDQEGKQKELVADHVIAGTGYRMDIRTLPFMEAALCDQIATEESSPVLSRNFESSVPGLYFIGTTAALSFGPLLRFTFGAGFTSPRLARHLRRTAQRGYRSEAAEQTTLHLRERTGAS